HPGRLVVQRFGSKPGRHPPAASFWLPSGAGASAYPIPAINPLPGANFRRWAVTYQGDGGEVKREIGSGQKIVESLPDNQAFYPTKVRIVGEHGHAVPERGRGNPHVIGRDRLAPQPQI